jgi:hypothetical protein
MLYHSEGCNNSETVFHWCYVNDLRTTHTVVCWVTASTTAVDRDVSGKLIGYLGFSRWGVFIGEGASSEVDRGGLTHRGRGQGQGRAALLCGRHVAPLHPLWKLW